MKLLYKIFIDFFMQSLFLPIPHLKHFNEILHEDQQIVHALDFMSMVNNSRNNTEYSLDR